MRSARWHSLQQGAGYGKVVNHVVIGLKTVKGTKQLRLDPTIYDSLQKARGKRSLTAHEVARSAGKGRDGRRHLHRGQQRVGASRWPLGCIRHGVRSGGRRVCPSAEGGCKEREVSRRVTSWVCTGRCAQEEGDRAGRDTPRPGCRERAASRRTRHRICPRADDEAEEDGDHGQAAPRDQQNRQPLHRSRCRPSTRPLPG